MPIKCWRFLIIDRRLAIFVLLLFGGPAGVGLVVAFRADRTFDLDSLAIVAIWALAQAATLVWVGRKRVVWLVAPWRQFRFRSVSYFTWLEGSWIQAEMVDGRSIGCVPTGGTFLDRELTIDRRETRLVQTLERARVDSGGDPSRAIRPRTRTPLGRS